MTDDQLLHIDDGSIVATYEGEPKELISVDLGGIGTELVANTDTVLFVQTTQIELIQTEEVWNQILFVEEQNLALLAWGGGGAGPAGPKGDTGATGPIGPIGPQGPAGPEGPQGPQGLQGDTGATGPQGPQGIQGDQGLQGVQGPQGDIGPTGPQGPQGDQGPQGIQGFTGPAGADGLDGADGAPGATGPAGPQGPIGPTGPAGADGADGADGVDGIIWDNTAWNTTETFVLNIGLLHDGSSYRCIANHTSTVNDEPGVGVDWETKWILLASKGDTGAQGPQGIQGIQGIQGVQGDTGPQGPQGDTGPQGIQGIQGIQGEQGPQGLQGIQGEDGPQGLQGPAGTNGADGADGLSINWRNDWLTATGYVINDAVTHNGASYIAISDHTSGAPSEPGVSGSWELYWDYLSAKGDTGPQGPQGIPGLNWIDGGWAGGQQYYEDDGLSYEGNSYRCILDHVSGGVNEPGTGGAWATYWEVVAAQGLQGEIGPAGQGIIPGGTVGQIIEKQSSTDFDVAWVTPSAGGSGNVIWDGFDDDWFSGTSIVEGRVMRDGFGNRDVFWARSAHTSSSTNQPREGTAWKSYWTPMGGGMAWRGTWINGNTGDAGDYYPQDVVVRNGVNYLCIAEHDADTVASPPGTGSSWASYWVVLGPASGATGATAAGKRRLWVPVSQMYPPDAGSSNAAASTPAVVQFGTTGNIMASYFDAATDEYLYFTWTPPLKWDRVNNPFVRMRFFWFPTSTNTGNVYWVGHVRGYDDGDILTSGPSSIYGVLDAGNGTINDMHRSDWEAFGYMTGVASDFPLLAFAVSRDANNASDTYTDDAGLIGVEIEYYVTDFADDS